MTHGVGGVERWMESLIEGVSTAVRSGLGCDYVECSRAGGMTRWNEVHRDKGGENSISLVA